MSALALEITSCTRCALCKTRTRAVPGEGPSAVSLMLIGEAPGRTEDESGRPFVGAAGKRLTGALEEAGFLRQDVFITNTVKCRPPQNRDPTADEKSACKPFLDRQLALLRPLLIVLLGRHAFATMLPAFASQYSITEACGKFFTQDGRQYLVVFHPSATIYDRKKYAALVSGLRAARSFVADKGL